MKSLERYLGMNGRMTEEEFENWCSSIRSISGGQVDFEYVAFDFGKNGGCTIKFTGIDTHDEN